MLNRMPNKLTYFCVVLLFAVFGPVSIAQSQTNDKFVTALESQLECRKTPEPAKATGALQRSGVIKRRAYLNTDSVSYFQVRRPLTIWGFKVVSVFGFDFNPRIFERGPGTAPPVTLGVVVAASESDIKAKLSSLGLANVGVNRPEDPDINPVRRKSTVVTEISCEQRYGTPKVPE